ncbi:hypothetical protein RY831_07670 [Noviherbaspirillum sp. CPCC 100848]|uniref:Secreted protein n=1 Tax=Noviherbaspirillum album TaxID=3080276 RepID=A0ABU6J5X5_9BURK|nr:hypothetical protein [Noviherbaspirillum sp. CPCC 100848]MEC4719021.1 hypothetical protein [Noviherbaspirillum sp. CPCC 100848]
MDISVSIASIFNAVWIAVLASRFVAAVLPVLREDVDAGDAEEAEDDDVPPEDPEARFAREASFSAGLAGCRSFFPKSEKIPTLSLAGSVDVQSLYGRRQITSV